MTETQLVLENVSKTYRRNEQALFETSIVVKCGVFGLLGPNGAGKTTLLRLIATLLAPTTGSLILDRFDSKSDRSEYRALLGYLPQRFGLYPHLTPHEYLAYTASLKKVAAADTQCQVDRLLNAVGLGAVIDRKIGSLSGGMRQRVGIASVLLGNPRLLVFDEPTAGLDPEERIRFRSLIDHVSQSSIVILSTHIVQDVELGCSRVAVLHGGKILSDCSPTELEASAKGRVWTVSVDRDRCERIRSVRSVTALEDVGNETRRVRFVGEALGIGEVPAEPTIEDAYVNCIKVLR